MIHVTAADALAGATGTTGDFSGTRDADLLWGRAHWRGRHIHGTALRSHAKVCALSEHGAPKFRCRCVGPVPSGRERCCEHANAEDGLCEPCRKWCAESDAPPQGA